MSIPHPRIVLAAVLVAAGVIGAAYAWTYWPPAPGTRSEIERALVGYELAPAPIWPAKYDGFPQLTPGIAAEPRAGYVRNLRLYATGHVLAFLLRRDFAEGLTDNRRWSHGGFEVAGSGRVVFFEFRGRRPNGDLVVRAAVQHTFTTGRWNARAETPGRVRAQPPRSGDLRLHAPPHGRPLESGDGDRLEVPRLAERARDLRPAGFRRATAAVMHLSSGCRAHL